MDASFAAVITAAGSSSRMGPAVKKEYLALGPSCLDKGGRPLTVLGAAVSAFAGLGEIAFIVITVPVEGEAEARSALPPELRAAPRPRILFVPGGPSRRASVHHALSLLAAYGPSWILIHDGARPWVSEALIRRVMEGAVRHAAAIPLLPLAETPKELEGAFIRRHLRRSNLGLAQTPQGFAFPAILQAHQRAAERELAEGYEYTDDAEVWGEFCGPVAVVPGERENRKITYPEDLIP
ncbi:MAG: 2-C-methyl-D-erythritol 4-phosphate cytidylyltransferase [Treponema sp.]|jgi:2-C-methyl-D-erythritol 4-phosphate cytidylyltransferase/2-C-methyl-D-erythritol 4-phosphate cytidylyltransferase/2-C-methyl-D-erythritol 2,4-cyclodiphosphate synthase|nr:2-C-methyl-D-erythritol 4-phosphate cytidylyltransferase [Treponema sp.]